MFSMRPPAVVAACVLLAVTGCAAASDPKGEGTGSLPPGEPVVTTAVDGESDREAEPGPPEEVVDAYMEALAAGSDPDRMREGLAWAAEGSPAHDYLTHRISVAQAWHDQGEPLEDVDVEHTGHGHTLCRDTDPGSGPVCEVFDGFTHEEGRLVDLLVDDIDPEPFLVRAEGVEEEHAGVRAVFLTAHRSQADDTLVVTVEFNTVDDVDLDLFGASYTTEAGDEIGSDLAVGRHELDAGAATRTAFSFPSAKPGGDLHVGGCLAECSTLVDITLPVHG